MSIKGIVWLHIGPGFGRFTFGPPHFGKVEPDDSEIYRALESIINDTQKVLVSHPITSWRGLAKISNLPRINNQKVIVDLAHYPPSITKKNDGAVVLRACLPFRAWPFGGRVVYEGWHQRREGPWKRFTIEELEEFW